MSAARPRRERPPPAGPRPALPLLRLLLLPVVAFLIALGLQAALAVSGVPAASPLRVFLTPAVAAAVVFLGLRPYPRAGRLRLALMVAVGVFLIALLT